MKISIIDQTGAYTYNAAQIISNHLQPFCRNDYTITDTQNVP